MNWDALLITLGVLTLVGGVAGTLHQAIEGEPISGIVWSLLATGTICLALGAGLTS